jgi:DNA-binding CsgD family transcriptional regulator
MSQPDQHSLEALASLALTPREAEVLFWISEGKSNHDIGVILGAKTGTICKHVEHILASSTSKIARPLRWWRSKRTAPPRRYLKVNLVKLGLRSPAFSRRSSVRYGQIVANFTTKSRAWPPEPDRLASALTSPFFQRYPPARQRLLLVSAPLARTGQKTLLAANAPPERRPAPARAALIRPQWRRVNQRSSTNRAPSKQSR